VLGGIQLKEKVIGILGGMDPEATAELFYRLIKTTPAQKDQDHLRVIIDNNPKIRIEQRPLWVGGLALYRRW